MSAKKDLFNKKNFQIKMGRISYQIKQFWKASWPINLNYYKNFKLVSLAIIKSSYPIKVLLAVSTVGTLISFLFTVYGTYLVLTDEVPKEGGYLVEAVTQEPASQMKIFNPVLDTVSDGERRINNLLYLPLYEVDFPDFLTESREPDIKPILLEEPPAWQNQQLNPDQTDNLFKVLNFKLRSDIKWTNGERITVEDVKYSFDRIKEPGGNSDFSVVFSNVVFEPVSQTEFNLVSEVSNPGLIYSANFSPISADYYQGMSNSELVKDPRSINPIVTSGYFILPDQVDNPETSRQDSQRNPFKDLESQIYTKVILTKNSVNNSGKDFYLDNYILKAYDTLNNVGGEADSVEKDALNGGVDLFSRFLGVNMNFTPSEARESLKMEQKVVPTNTYYNLYLNIEAGTSFINRDLRRYVICKMVDFEPGRFDNHEEYLEEIPAEKKLIPLHFQTSSEPSCEGAREGLNGTYTWRIDEANNIEQILLSGRKLNLTMLALNNSDALVRDVQSYFKDIGLPVSVIKNEAQVFERLSTGDYNAVLLPITMASRDPYSLYGVGGRNISRVTSNARVNDYNFEDNLKRYSLSEGVDEESKRQLVKFFNEQFISVNLYRTKQEFNYSVRVKGVEQNLPSVVTFIEEVYRLMPDWYVETRREF